MLHRYATSVPRARDPAVRVLLVERAAALLRQREPVTLRSLTAETPVSTMAVYTYFGGMDGLWSAVRQEGFTRLAARLGAVPTGTDAVRDLASLAAAYVAHALEQPNFYRVMFDADFPLEDLAAADAALEHLVQAAGRARASGRVRDDVEPLDLAVRTWAVTHGLVSLVSTGPLPPDSLGHAPALLQAVLVAAGDQPDRCRVSTERGWRSVGPAAPPDRGSA